MRDPQRSRIDILISFVLTVFIVIFDRITKNYFEDLLDLGQTLPVIPDIFHFTLVYNTGIAFGLFKDQGVVFIIIPVIAIILLVFNIYYFRQNGEVISRGYMLAFSLILAGAMGNLYDRITYGYVIDFFDFRIWPVFNIADSAITIGAVIIAWKCFRLSSDK
ncbi:MAG: signal peptidase II [Candidatus Omnitrophica bacterium]|nr:signal peptidase II [Candidatus Omnitrophota bacterium]